MANGLRKVDTISEFPNAVDLDSVYYAKLDEEVGYFRRVSVVLTYRNGDKVKLYSVSGITADMIANPTELASILMPETIVAIEDNAFSDCHNLTCVEMSPNITRIGSYAFYNCSSLTSLVIPDSVKSYEGNSFVGCSGITELYIGSGITYSNSIFYNITNIEVLTCYADISIGNNGESIYQSQDNLRNITIGGKTEIGPAAFSSFHMLSGVTILDEVADIGMDAFASCSGITEIHLPNSVTYIDESAFNTCENLTYIDLNQVKYIDRYAFQNCTSLTEIIIPSTVTDVQTRAFAGCTNLTDIFYNAERLRPDTIMWTQAQNIKLTIGSNVSNFNGQNFGSAGGGISEVDYRSSFMPSYVFYNCMNLVNVTFSNDVTYISQSAFEKCVSLASIDIPNSVTEIASDAFAGCSNLSVINYDGPASGYPWGAPLLSE